MKKPTILLLLMLPLLSFTAAHKFYVSATDIEYDKEEQALQIISYVFVDDLQKLLKERYDDELVLYEGKEHPKADQYIEKYFQDKFKIKVHGKNQKLNYIGKEYDKDQLLIYLEVENIAPFQKIAVENGVLTDVFPQQKNVVKVDVGGKIKSLLLSRYQPNGTLNFEK